MLGMFMLQRVWKFVYVAGAILCLGAGYGSLAPERTEKSNADWIFVTIAFLGMGPFPLCAMAYSRHIGVESFRRPSLDRPPFGWWRDTLQPLRVSLLGVGLYFSGACLSLPKADHRGVMILWLYAAATVGLLIGERLVYKIHAKRIA